MKPSLRNVRADSKGTMYVSIPKQFVKAMELSKGQKLRIDMLTKNRLEIVKEVDTNEM